MGGRKETSHLLRVTRWGPVTTCPSSFCPDEPGCPAGTSTASLPPPAPTLPFFPYLSFFLSSTRPASQQQGGCGSPLPAGLPAGGRAAPHSPSGRGLTVPSGSQCPQIREKLTVLPQLMAGQPRHRPGLHAPLKCPQSRRSPVGFSPCGIYKAHSHGKHP